MRIQRSATISPSGRPTRSTGGDACSVAISGGDTMPIEGDQRGPPAGRDGRTPSMRMCTTYVAIVAAAYSVEGLAAILRA